MTEPSANNKHKYGWYWYDSLSLNFIYIELRGTQEAIITCFGSPKPVIVRSVSSGLLNVSNLHTSQTQQYMEYIWIPYSIEETNKSPRRVWSCHTQTHIVTSSKSFHMWKPAGWQGEDSPHWGSRGGSSSTKGLAPNAPSHLSEEPKPELMPWNRLRGFWRKSKDTARKPMNLQLKFVRTPASPIPNQEKITQWFCNTFRPTLRVFASHTFTRGCRIAR